jgi:hypothetical protein
MKELTRNTIIDRTTMYLFSAIILVFVLSFFLRKPDGDEGMIAEHSYWLQEIGYVKSVMCTGLGFGWETIQYHYHKLFVVCGAFLIKVFGINQTVLRLFILSFSLLLVYFIYLYYKSRTTFNKSHLLLAVLLLYFQYHFFYFSYIFRPEIPVACLGFISFYFLNKHIDTQRKSFLLLAGLFSGLSALMHLNGMTYSIAGVSYLIVKKEYRNSLYFLLVSTVVTLLYFFNITNLHDFKAFVYQFTNDPNLSNSDFTIFGKFDKLLNEHKRYFHSPKEIVLSLLFFCTLVFNFKKLYRKNSSLVLYSVLVLISLAAIAHDKTDKYSLLYVPFMIVIIVEGLTDLQNSTTFYKRTMMVLIPLYFVVNSIFIGKVIAEHNNLAESNRYYASFMPQKNVNILTRESFFFNEMKNYQIISTLSFEYRWKRLNTTAATDEDFYEFAHSNNVYYILLENNSANRGLLDVIHYNQINEGNSHQGFTVVKKTNDFILLKEDVVNIVR